MADYAAHYDQLPEEKPAETPTFGDYPRGNS
jgi:hypothetical protein